MFELRVLEYDKILEIISKYSISRLGRDRILKLEPKSNRETIELELNKLKEIYRLSNYNIDFVPPVINDIYPMLKKVSITNSYVTDIDLHRIRQNIKSFTFLRKIIKPYLKYCPIIGSMFKNISPPYDLVDMINGVVDEQGNLRDDASEKLIGINEKIKSLKKSIEKILKNYFSSPETKDFIQEPTITIKNDRYVIPLKHSYMGKVPGVVHAHSGSNQTVFVEPFTITDKNNEIKILEKEKEKEIRRILRDCSVRIHARENELKLIQDILVEIDFIHAKLRFMKDYQSVFPEFINERTVIIEEGRHPLIKSNVVPLNLKIDKEYRAVVITGPNTGGKTVLLKTIGLFICMAQSALPVPANNFRSQVFKSVFAEIGDEQSIEQSLSTFSAHIKHIKDIINSATSDSIVLIDELGAGTDPIEGGAIGTAILDHMRERNILTLVTTHLSMIKMYALEHRDVLVASVQFNPKTLRPTYRVVLGIPGRSNALEIAEMLGLQRDILNRTKLYMGEKERSFDNVLKRLSEMEITLSKKENDLSVKNREIEEKLKDFNQKNKILSDMELFYKSRFEREVEELLSSYRKKLERAIHSVVRNSASKESIKKAKSTIEKTKEFLKEYEKEAFKVYSDEKKEEIKTGMDVKVRTPAGKWVRGTVSEMDEKKVTVRAGLLKMVVSVDDVDPIEIPPSEKEIKIVNKANYDVETIGRPSMSCDIRGKRFEEAMLEVERFLDKALLTSIDRVLIIHGLGTGALREGVWNYLGSCNFVSKYYYARPEEGGFGCTIVELKR
ncbi:MAG: hypothetical protein DRP84_11545 [Spirochaetes bacterium]|nr:MAG: hypothetical protein DRP84_11545 [Spirochaetota bacterium]